MFKAPKKVINELETIRRRLLWDGNSNKRKIHWINWEKILKKKKDGGLGVNCLRPMNLALPIKWWWGHYRKNQPYGLSV
jgi:hypothetical protein